MLWCWVSVMAMQPKRWLENGGWGEHWEPSPFYTFICAQITLPVLYTSTSLPIWLCTNQPQNSLPESFILPLFPETAFKTNSKVSAGRLGWFKVSSSSFPCCLCFSTSSVAWPLYAGSLLEMFFISFLTPQTEKCFSVWRGGGFLVVWWQHIVLLADAALPLAHLHGSQDSPGAPCARQGALKLSSISDYSSLWLLGISHKFCP